MPPSSSLKNQKKREAVMPSRNMDSSYPGAHHRPRFQPRAESRPFDISHARHPNEVQSRGRYRHADEYGCYETSKTYAGRWQGYDRNARRAHAATSQSNLSFQKAFQRLHRILEAAAHFFDDFERSFKEETNIIREYADQNVLDQLWSNKIRSHELKATGEKFSNSQEAGKNSDNDDNESVQSCPVEKQTFSYMFKKLSSAFNATFAASSNPTQSSRSNSTSAIEQDSIQRLGRQLRTQLPELGRLFNKACEHQEYCQELVKEAHAVLGYLGTSEELWRPERQDHDDKNLGERFSHKDIAGYDESKGETGSGSVDSKGNDSSLRIPWSILQFLRTNGLLMLSLGNRRQ